MRLTGLMRFPVKSCRGESVDEAIVDPWGLGGDRRWMLVDETGETLTARRHPRMLLLTPRYADGGGLVVSAPSGAGVADLRVALPNGHEHTEVTIFGGEPFAAAPAEDPAHAWFSEVLDRPVRLVWAENSTRRRADPDFAGAEVAMAFADGYPLNVATEDSLAALNELIASGPRADEGGVRMVRFRPNLIVAGAEPWTEDGWRRLRVGSAYFSVVKGCDRCTIPTTDPDTARRFKEPTATLARHRRFDGAVWFGMQLVPQNPGTRLRVGDDVEVLESVPEPDGPPR